MKRFSKIVSVIIAAPSAIVISAMICACRSVGKPGIRLGHHVDAVRGRRCAADARCRRLVVVDRDAGRVERARAPPRDGRAGAPTSSTSPPVIAAAIA